MPARFSWLAALALVFGWALPARAEPIDIILEVALSSPGNLGDPTFNVLNLYNSDFFGPVAEQYPASLQAKISGHLRVRVDPDNLDTLRFVGQGSYLSLSTGDRVHLVSVSEDSLAYPGGTPANLALTLANDASVLGALRNLRFEFVSQEISLAHPDPVNQPSVYVFDPQQISGRVLAGEFQTENAPVLGTGTYNLTAYSLNNNLAQSAGLLDWGPAIDPSVTTIGGGFQFVYQFQPFGALFTLNFTGDVQMSGEFSAENYESVTSSGQVVHLLGGATQSGGVTAIGQGLSSEGTLVAQQIGLNGLPVGALEAAMAVPDLAYSLSLSGYTNPTWNLDFTGEATEFDVTLNYGDYTNPEFSESRLVLYHFNESGQWEKVAGQVLDTQLNTVRYTNPTFSPFLLAVAVPEPSGCALACGGLAGWALIVRRRIERGWRRSQLSRRLEEDEPCSGT